MPATRRILKNVAPAHQLPNTIARSEQRAANKNGRPFRSARCDLIRYRNVSLLLLAVSADELDALLRFGNIVLPLVLVLDRDRAFEVLRLVGVEDALEVRDSG